MSTVIEKVKQVISLFNIEISDELESKLTNSNSIDEISEILNEYFVKIDNILIPKK